MNNDKTNQSMFLSESIRLGSMLGPQAHGVLQDGDGTCAFGAAVLAGLPMETAISDGRMVGEVRGESYRLPRGTPYERVAEHVAVVLRREMPCPVCRQTVEWGQLAQLIPHLNDAHLWTRERIAEVGV